jgi:hypothetical protein
MLTFSWRIFLYLVLVSKVDGDLKLSLIYSELESGNDIADFSLYRFAISRFVNTFIWSGWCCTLSRTVSVDDSVWSWSSKIDDSWLIVTNPTLDNTNSTNRCLMDSIFFMRMNRIVFMHLGWLFLNIAALSVRGHFGNSAR